MDGHIFGGIVWIGIGIGFNILSRLIIEHWAIILDERKKRNSHKSGVASASKILMRKFSDWINYMWMFANE